MPAEAKTFRTKGGRELTFLFDIDGITAAEDAANAGFKQLLIGAMAEERLGYLAALVYGGLKSAHPEISRAEAWELLRGPDGKALGAAMREALETAMPELRGGPAHPRKAAASGTGSRSSPPGSKKASPRKGSGSRPRAATKS